MFASDKLFPLINSSGSSATLSPDFLRRLLWNNFLNSSGNEASADPEEERKEQIKKWVFYWGEIQWTQLAKELLV